MLVNFLFKRLIQAAVVMFFISLLGFSIQNQLGDPLRELVGQSVSEAERQTLRESMGLNDPFLTQYIRFAKKALAGDFGDSYFFKKPTLSVIADKFPATFELVLAASFLICFISIPIGIYAAIYPNKIRSRLLMGFSIIGISIPVFLTAIFLIYLFSVMLGWLPSFGRGDLAQLPWGWQSGFLTKDGLLHLILPAVSLASIMLPMFIRLTRAEMMETLRSEYVRFAWAKGLSPLKVWLRHAFRNCLLPLITIGGVQIGTLIAYTILTETVFQWPGMGLLFLEAIHRVDTPLIIAYIIIVGFIFVVINTLVDLIYMLVNPALKITEKNA